VWREGDRLLGKAPGIGKAQIFPESQTQFFAKRSDTQVTSVLDGAGRPLEMVVRLDDGTVLQARRRAPLAPQ
jgi:hypothetical protein